MMHRKAPQLDIAHLLSRTAHAGVGAAASLLASTLALCACGSDDAIIVEPGAGGTETPETPETPTGQPETPAPGDTNGGSAIMLVGQVFSPEAYNTYVGIFPEVPEGDIDFASFREFGNANAYSAAGYVFVEQDGVMQRFSVDENLALVAGPRFSWQDFGIGSINTSYTVFVSAQRAYTFAPELGVTIVWSPEQMILLGTLPMELTRPDGMETFAYDGALVGDKVIWNVFSGNWDSITPYPAVTLAIADANSDAPVRFVEDDRCVPGGPARVGADGNYYVHANGYYGYFLTYGLPAARTCMLRFDAARETFDPAFLVDYQTLMGSSVSEPWFYVSGDEYVSRVWDPAVPFPENPDEFWDNAAFRPLRVNPVAGTAVPYPDLAAGKGIDGTMRILDGDSYYQLSQTGYVEGGTTDVVVLRPEGVVPKFHLDGFLLGLERVR